MQNVFYMPPEVQSSFRQVRSELTAFLQSQPDLSERDCDLFWARLERYWTDFYTAFARLYGQREDLETQVLAVARLAAEQFASRSATLQKLDLEREITPDWFQRETMTGGIYYVDLFAGTLTGVRQHLEYIRDLGLSFIHLMPLLQPRTGPNDGGYAVEDYRAVNRELGTMADLAELAAELHESGMSLCIDLVLNHTAKEHEWARQAMAGDPEYLDYYFTYDDRTIPDQYEKTLPEVFPDFKPGNFTYYPQMAAGKGKWVWTTFNEYQWDLNYTNPAVFRGMLGYMLFLANQGVDVLRLDAVPFMWKRLGTDSQNQPEVHDLVQAFRAITRIVAPSTIFMAEAIVPPHQLLPYLGVGRHSGRECEIAYHNSLMVLLWSSLASRKVSIMTESLRNIPQNPPGTTWITYVRCHDDIGWAITDENAEAVGENGFMHRQFLNRFYSGAFAGSFALGEIFQFNPKTGDGRMSGMTASLAGLERALLDKDPHAVDLALQRILLLYSVIMSYGGIPLVYMGDEIGLLNDRKYRDDPLKSADNRWMHRPPMDWTKAAERHDPTSLPGRFFQGMRELVAARRRIPQLHGAASTEALWTDNQHVFAYLRRHSSGKMLGLANFSEQPHFINADLVWPQGFQPPLMNVLPATPQPLTLVDNRLILAPYQAVWLVNPAD